MGAGEDESTDALWDALMDEVERLTATRPRGVNCSEDFAVDRVCAALKKLKLQHRPKVAKESTPASPAANAAARGGNGAGAEELVSLRVELAMEEQRLKIQQTKLDEARLQVKQAREKKAELEQQVHAEESARRQASEGQAKEWRESALKTHKCLASLRAKEQEVLQLQAALKKPDNIQEVYESLIKKMQAELDKARADEAESRRELGRLTAEVSGIERRETLTRSLSSSLAAPSGTSSALAALSSSLNAPSGTSSAIAALAANSRSDVAALGRSNPDATDRETRESVREELLRIASRASDSARSLQATVASMGACASGRSPVSSGSGQAPTGTSPKNNTFSASSGAGAERAGLGSLKFQSSLEGSGKGIREDAKRVVEKSESANLQHGMTTTTLTPQGVQPTASSMGR